MADEVGTPGVYLAEGRCLVGEDMLPVVQRLLEMDGENRPDEAALASISSTHSLLSYEEGELKDEFLKLKDTRLALMFLSGHVINCYSLSMVPVLSVSLSFYVVALYINKLFD